jgi:N-acyl-D-amino-acid deacylase
MFFSVSALAQSKNQVDILIKNAYVFNGDGGDSVLTNIGITKDRIAYIGKKDIAAKETIDAKGKYVAPGFIDPHTHADRHLTVKGKNELLSWVYQGVTTVFTGSDGFGPYNIAKKFSEFEKNGMGTNVAQFVGFGPIRTKIVGQDDVKASVEQITEMKKLVAKGMQEGAIGFSTGLIYLPQMFSQSDEIIELSKEAAKYGAIYDSHMRNENNQLVKSVKEVLQINKEGGLPVHMSHLKVTGEPNWGKSAEIINMVNEARAKGINITANQYPFIASMTSLKATLIPAWAQAGGSKKMIARFNNPDDLAKIKEELAKRSDERNKLIWVMSRNEKFKDMYAKSLYQISVEKKISVPDLVIECIKADTGISIMNFSMTENDIVAFMKQPWVMTGSDGGGSHPRTYSTFTRILEEYVMKRNAISMSWAIRRGTGLTADVFKLKDRGYIKLGYYADVIVFDSKRVKANSTYNDPEQLSEGMDYVFVNGTKAIDKGVKTGALAGKIIRREQ